MKGDLYINGNDAFERYGLNFEEGALCALMTPAPKKAHIESHSRLLHGKKVVTKLSRFDSRELTLPFHIIARSKSEFFEKYERFCSEVLAAGSFEVKYRHSPGKIYRLNYISCSQFRQFAQEMAVFTLKVEEPDPTNRGEIQ